MNHDTPSYYINIEKRKMTTTGDNAGKYHIKLWVTFKYSVNGVKQWKQRPYKTGLFCTLKDYGVVVGDKKNVPVLIKDLRDSIREVKNKAAHIIDDLKIRTQEQFEALYLSEHQVESVALHIKEKISELKAAKKYSSAEKYQTALTSFTQFFKTDSFTFNMCTDEKLQAYEDWYISQDHGKKKKSLTSVGINMRNLRHIFNRVIKKGIIAKEVYPFGIGRYVIPEGGDDTKKFLSTEEKNGFLNWSHADSRITWLHAAAKFCYFAYGINLSDFARLRKSSVFKDYIAIDRQKTKGRKKKSKKLIIPIHPVMAEIMKRHGKPSLIPDDYVFPVLDLSMDEETVFYKIRDLVDDVNKVLEMIGKELNFEIKPTSYTIRHTFSFHFMQLGGTTDELQDALAHGSSKTTENYKHGFSLERKKKFSNGL